MKIGITLYPYGEKQPAGLAETIFSLSEGLSNLPPEHQLVFIAKGSNQVEPSFIKNKGHCEFRTVSAENFWLDAAVKENTDIDVWIFNTPMMPLFRKPKKSIVIALDFAYLHFKPTSLKAMLQNKITKFLNARALSRANQVVSISEFTSTEVTTLFPSITKEKVTTIMAGYRDVASIAPEEFNESLPSDFFLSVGVIKPRKNVLTTVKAFLHAKSKGLKSSLVICGSGEGLYADEVREVIFQSKHKDAIIMAGYVTDGQIATAYRSAKALVFPTKLEGFGFPVLEAMSMRLPVITSTTNSVGEIAGDAAICVDPDSVEQLASAILQMEDDAVRQEYIERGNERITHFSWQKTATKLLEVVKKM